MGCSSSRLDDLPAVALCRRRRKSIDAANHHFTSLAESHTAYMQSMISIGQALVRTLPQFPPHVSTGPEMKLAVVLDVERKNSDSGHIQFTPSSDDEEEKNVNRQGTVDKGSNYGYLMNGVEERFGGFAVAVYGNQIDHTPPPPPPPPPESSLTWNLMNFFTPYDMSLHCPERYNLLSGRADADAGEDPDESKTDIKEVVQVKRTVKSEVAEEKCEAKDVKEVITLGAAEGQKKLKSAVDVLEEVNVLFEKASEAGIGVLKLLKAEADDHNYVFQLHSSEKSNLASILRKLSIWEHKLHTEVKAEEEMRLRHEDLQKRLRKQYEKGSESQKVDATQKAIMSLNPTMKIAFDMVNRISIVISKLRDGELWPCLNQFIHELQGMWVSMLDCHTQQAKAIKEVADLHSFPSDGELTNAQLEAAMELKHELQNWIISFCNWTGSQKGYVKSLNKWLQRCFLPELKEQTESDESESNRPSSNAPLISIICHKWSEEMKNLDDDKVVEAMEACIASVDQMLQRLSANIQQRVIIDGDLEKRVKKMEAKDKEMLKALDGWKKNVKKEIPAAASDTNLSTDASKNDQKNLQPELKRALESLESLAASFVDMYQDLSLSAKGENQMNVAKTNTDDFIR